MVLDLAHQRLGETTPRYLPNDELQGEFSNWLLTP